MAVRVLRYLNRTLVEFLLTIHRHGHRFDEFTTYHLQKHGIDPRRRQGELESSTYHCLLWRWVRILVQLTIGKTKHEVSHGVRRTLRCWGPDFNFVTSGVMDSTGPELRKRTSHSGK